MEFTVFLRKDTLLKKFPLIPTIRQLRDEINYHTNWLTCISLVPSGDFPYNLKDRKKPTIVFSFSFSEVHTLHKMDDNEQTCTSPGTLLSMFTGGRRFTLGVDCQSFLCPWSHDICILLLKIVELTRNVFWEGV